LKAVRIGSCSCINDVTYWQMRNTFTVTARWYAKQLSCHPFKARIL